MTAELLARWLGVSVQRANARVRTLETAGFLGRTESRLGEARAIFVTGRGCELLGQSRRRPPRAEVQRAHELAIVRLCLLIERRSPDATRVLTEREIRGLERRGDRFSIDLAGGGPRRDRRHWPDLVVMAGERRTAVEVEFAPKGTARLQSIIGAYVASGYAEVRYVVTSPVLAARIVSLARSAWLPFNAGAPTPVVAVPWFDLSKEVAARVTAVNGRPR